MQLKRFFIKDLGLELSKTYELKQEDYNYIVNVMRLRLNDTLSIANNTGYDFLCQIVSITKNGITIKVLEKEENLSESKVNVTVCQALVKGDKFEFITQKIVELGVNTLIPFTSTFTIVKDNTQKTERLNKIAEQASSQCGRSKTLNITEIVSIKDLPKLLNSYDLVLLAYEKANFSLQTVLKNSKNCKNIAIIVGSEGGFSESEVTYLEKELKNLKTVSLGLRILRSETASIVLTSAVMYEMGELS